MAAAAEVMILDEVPCLIIKCKMRCHDQYLYGLCALFPRECNLRKRGRSRDLNSLTNNLYLCLVASGSVTVTVVTVVELALVDSKSLTGSPD